MRRRIEVVYEGPGLSGKASSLAHIVTPLPRRCPGSSVLAFSVLSEGDVEVHVSAVAGPIHVQGRRAQLLARADVVVFVVDSQVERMEANVEALRQVRAALAAAGRAGAPIVFQLNKRDLANALPAAEILEQLAAEGAIAVPSIATRGEGVREAFFAAVRHAVDG